MSAMTDPFDLARFVAAQRDVFDVALVEVASGRKRSHWMWYVFPQLMGLGRSATAQKYALRTREEASAYLAHPLLGARLREIAQALLAVEGRSAHDIFGTPDDLKLRSCCTLFAAVAPPGSVFEHVLAKYFNSVPDAETLRLLDQG